MSTPSSDRPITAARSTVILDAVQRLIEAADPERIILFGSYARGQQSSGSDIDLIVIADHPIDRFHEMVRLRRVLLSLPIPVDVLVYSADDVRERGHWLGTPLNHALSEGRVLYARG